MALFLPVVRADLAITDAYVYPPESPLDCPIHAFGGEADHTVPKADLDAWREQTTGRFTLRLFPGGHFYLNEANGSALARAVWKELEGLKH